MADAGKHYRYEYKGVKLDPYRIFQIYGIDGGPREHILKKVLRGTSKGHSETKLVQEILCSAERWKEMLIEDGLWEGPVLQEQPPSADQLSHKMEWWQGREEYLRKRLMAALKLPYFTPGDRVKILPHGPSERKYNTHIKLQAGQCGTIEPFPSHDFPEDAYQVKLDDGGVGGIDASILTYA